MQTIDYSLVHRARKLMTGANVHRIKTWIFCYENSEPNSPNQEHYEKLLREFLFTSTRIAGARAHGSRRS
jgi:hypothetical protein